MEKKKEPKEPTTNLSGLWIDPVATVHGAFLKSAPKTFAGCVRMLTSKVLENVNKVYSLDPPLKRADMIIDTINGNTSPALLSLLLNVFIGEVKDEVNIHEIEDIDETGLIVLIKPNDAAASRIKRRFKTLRETEKKTSELIGFICDEDSDDEGTFTTRLHSSCLIRRLQLRLVA